MRIAELASYQKTAPIRSGSVAFFAERGLCTRNHAVSPLIFGVIQRRICRGQQFIHGAFIHAARHTDADGYGHRTGSRHQAGVGNLFTVSFKTRVNFLF